MTALRLEGVVRRYGAHRAVDGVDLDLDAGTYLSLVGPSGCGKTTLLNVIAGLLRPQEGRVWINGHDVTSKPAHKRDVGLVFQEPTLYPHLSVRGNLDMPLRSVTLSKRERRERVEATASDLGLTALLEQRADTLSGGQAQRVALGRALVRRPALLLLDEPLANLDPPSRAMLRDVLRDRHDRAPVTTVHVTHDQEEALALGDRVAVMHGGRLHQVDAPMTVHDTPADTTVAALVGAAPMNLLAGRVEVDAAGARFIPTGPNGAGLALPGRLRAEAERAQGDVTLGVRASAVRAAVDGALGSVPLVVTRVTPIGDQIDVQLRDGDDGAVWRARVPRGQWHAKAGHRVTMQIDVDAVHLFGADGTRLGHPHRD